jgi:hypothetical protein
MEEAADRPGSAAGTVAVPASFKLCAHSRGRTWPEQRRNSQGQKGYFTVVLSSRKQEMNILLGVMSMSKFDNNKSIHQQITPFSMSTGKEGHFQCP